jgi:hypothetical protein
LKVVFFAWSAALRKILIVYNLKKWNLIVIDWCCMCKKSEKIVEFIFDLCALTGGGSLCKLERKIRYTMWKIILSCLMWCIWRENYLSFYDCERMMVELKAFFSFKTFYQWTTSYGCLPISNFLDFLDLVFF